MSTQQQTKSLIPSSDSREEEKMLRNNYNNKNKTNQCNNKAVGGCPSSDLELSQGQSTEPPKASGSNFLSKFRDKDTKVLSSLNSTQFMEVWNNYDKDGDGFISGRELDRFLREFVASVSSAEIDANVMSRQKVKTINKLARFITCYATNKPKAISSKVLAELKQTFLEAYDENLDGKIDIRELAQLLPLEESFLLLFRFDHLLDSSVEFMKIWTNYDKDSSGYIEADELKNFLSDLIKESRTEQVSEDKLLEYTDTILNIFDTNRDGKLQLSEMARLLPVKENFLNRSAFKGASKITKDDIERVFELYDRDGNGCIENEELGGFLKDLLELVKKDYDASDLAEFQDAILRGCDFNKDGKINKRELTMILLALSRHANQEAL